MKELRIKDICDKGSSNLKQKDVEGKKGCYPVYGASGIISHIDTYHQDENYIAIVKDGSGIGRVSFMPAKSSVIGTMQYILPKIGFNINYIGYCLQSLDLSKYKQGAAIPHIYFRDYGERIVKVSEDVNEQQRIVDYLDSAFAKIDAMKANAEKALNEAKALFQASLKEMLEPKEGWEEDTLINVFNFIDYRGATPKKLQRGVPLVTAKNVKCGYIDYTIKDYISKEEYETRKGRGISRKGDLLITTEAPLGNVAIADLDEFSAGQRLITLQQYDNPKYEFINEFYYYYMLSFPFQKRINEMATGATAQGIKAKLLKTIIVPIPPLSEQQSIVATLDSLKSKVDKLQENYDKISQECDALKQAILRDIFE